MGHRQHRTRIAGKWQQGFINAPTVLNSSLNAARFRDGRAADAGAGKVSDRCWARDRWLPGWRWPRWT
jgi:hypothetical protein